MTHSIKEAEIALLSSCGKNKISDEEALNQVQGIEKLLKKKVYYFENHFPSKDQITAGSITERAFHLSLALTRRNLKTLWITRGGYGGTELPKLLEGILPPIIGPKTLIGYSDISFLGVYLGLKYKNLRFIHARQAFYPHLFKNPFVLNKRSQVISQNL
jgi:UDP-N-acetylmuramate: L-alanyl-gamma-D-glutamyl-meso-diaminopimelate ligase